MQNIITKLLDITFTNKLSSNAEKILSNRQHGFQKFYFLSYTMDGVGVERADKFTYLGVILDQQLNFKLHADQVAARTQTLAMQAGRLARYIGKRQINITIYNVYIEPIILYAAPVWAYLTAAKLEDVSRAHHITTKFTLSAPWRPHIAISITKQDVKD